MPARVHSADYFGDTRDFWWNRDFLQLMSVRWKLHAVRTVLDVGCGVGHWSRCLAPFLPDGCKLTGVDREMRSLDEARRRVPGNGNLMTSFVEAAAEQLPFPEGSFHMVTCQTVLIHLNDPLAALREMIRVLAPGGLIAIIEPNNAASNLDDFDPGKPLRETLELLELQMLCERGKRNLGEGFNSAGPLVPGWLAGLGIEHIESCLSDKTTMLLPPYESPQEQAILRELADRHRREFWLWDRVDTLRYFVAGGGDPSAFTALWDRALSREKMLLDEVTRKNRGLTFTPVCLLAWGRKKAG